jgi:methionyl-tRNA formyltransferase
MKLIFMGTPQLVVPILDTLAEHHEVSLVVTQPDRPKGRGRKLEPPPIKIRAQEQGIPVLQPESLKSDSFHQAIREQQADLIVVVAFSILPSSLFSLTRWGAINLHTSLLPKFRGAAPIQWAIIKGETETGVTVFSLDEKMDHGTILGQRTKVIEENETSGDLGQTLMVLGQELLLDVLDNMAKQTLTPREQDHGDATGARKLCKEDGEVYWGKSVQEIHNQVRGMNPYPIAYSYLQSDDVSKKPLKVRLHLTEKTNEPATLPPGTLIKGPDKFPRVHCKDFQLILKQVQLDGKPKVSGDSFLNGLQNNSKEKTSLFLINQERKTSHE